MMFDRRRLRSALRFRDRLKEYQNEIIQHDIRMLQSVSIIGTIIGLALLILSLPGIGVLKLTLAYLLLALFFGIMLIIARKLLPEKPVLVLPFFYLFMAAIMALTIYMGTIMGTTTNATTFLLALLIVPLFVIDNPWRVIGFNGLFMASFIICARIYKPQGDILSLDISNSIVIYVISSITVFMSAKRQIHLFELHRREDDKLKEKDILINAIPAGIGVFEVKAGRVSQVFMNDGYYRLLEDDRENRESRNGGNFMNGIHPDDRPKVAGKINEVIGGEDYITLNCRAQKGDGSYMWIRLSSSVEFRDGDFIKVYSTYASMEEEMKSKQETKAKTEFLSRMSHDIRTPMNAIIGMTRLAKDEKDINTIREYLNNIDFSSEFLLGLINDILDLSKIESGEFTLNPEVYSAGEFTESVDSIIRPLMEQKNIKFDMDLNLSSEYIYIDKLRLNQIFFNLLSNAAKFTHNGGHVVFTAYEEKDTDNKVVTCFTVKDNGIGMSSDFLKDLFVPFRQEKNYEGDFSTGTGLGLPIVKSLIEAMGGNIAVRSRQGIGTEYKVRLYIDKAEKPSKDRQKTHEEISLNKLRILLVEDNTMNVLVAKKLLESKGCIVTVAVNGQEAVDLFAVSEPGYYRIILMDVRMPVMDGLEATRTIRGLDREDAPSVPIIAMTADAFTEEQKRTFDAGMNYHLSKPINPQELFDVIKRYA